MADGRDWKYLGSASVTEFFFFFLGLAVLVEHGPLEALADQLRADELAVDVDLLAVGVAREGDLADAGDHERVDQAEQNREDDDADD